MREKLQKCKKKYKRYMYKHRYKYIMCKKIYLQVHKTRKKWKYDSKFVEVNTSRNMTTRSKQK